MQREAMDENLLGGLGKQESQPEQHSAYGQLQTQ